MPERNQSHTDELEIRALVHRYADAASRRDPAGVAGTFTGDGEWVAATIGQYRGRDAIADATPQLGMGIADYVAAHDIDAVVTAGDLTRFDLAGIDRVALAEPIAAIDPLSMTAASGPP